MKRLIAEFERQTYTQIIFPHQKSDWIDYLEEAQEAFVNLINAVTKFQPCLIIAYDIKSVQKYFTPHKNLHFVHYKTDDTWARDCSALSIETHNTTYNVIELLDFTFNAWGGKYPATQDNLLTRTLYKNAKRCDFVLEGGAIESNGEGILLSTKKSMLNPNRNASLNKKEILQALKHFFGVKDVLLLNNGFLLGDDTDAHIDTLVRFISKDTLMYVQCCDTKDAHFKELLAMERELKVFANEYNFKLIAIPMVDALYFEGERLPATYANFLFVNGGLILPIYKCASDALALEIFKKSFPHRKILEVDASVFVRENGSIHCLSMQMYTPLEFVQSTNF